MTRFLSRLRPFFLGATLLAAPVLAEQPSLKPFNADYVASYMGMEGNATMSLAPAASGQWKYTLSIRSSLASLSQSTLFDEHGGQWRPLSGSDNASVLIKKTTKRANYDWERGVATWSGDVKPDRAGPVKLQAGDLDAMLVNLAIARDVAAGKPLHYRMVDDGRAKDLVYTVSGKEQVTVGGKKQQATKVSRTDGNKQTLVWIVDGLPVPARILQRKNGEDEMDLQLKSMR
jgi:uncharacterized protein DUF3108